MKGKKTLLAILASIIFGAGALGCGKTEVIYKGYTKDWSMVTYEKLSGFESIDKDPDYKMEIESVSGETRWFIYDTNMDGRINVEGKDVVYITTPGKIFNKVTRYEGSTNEERKILKKADEMYQSKKGEIVDILRQTSSRDIFKKYFEDGK